VHFKAHPVSLAASRTFERKGMEMNANPYLYVVITVDTEDSQRLAVVYDRSLSEIDSMIYGRIDTEEHSYGFTKVMEICDRYDCKATFFVSVFDYGKYGNSAIGKICRQIKQRGHDVQLHTHPRWIYDKSRGEMHKYSLNEQKTIIGEGKRLIREWISEYPVAHRAGAYGLNGDTIAALKEHRILMDSSMFYQHPECKLTWSRNKVVARDEMLEIPVTGFFRDIVFTVGGLPITRRRRFIKTDVDWASLDELLFFVEEAKQRDIRVLDLFMHSYSFIHFNEDFTHFEPDYQDMQKFERFLAFARSDPAIKVVTMRDLHELYSRDPSSLLGGSDYVPVYRQETRLPNRIGQLLQRRWRGLW
jgi:peptidoglycan/xylan/chitin deacetylase (PgdA/CDA1 family)